MLILPTLGMAQIDSLKSILPQLKGEEKSKALADICWFSRLASQPDSAKKYGRKALEFSTKIQYLPGVAQAYNDLGILEIDKSNYPKALSLFDSALTIRKAQNDTLGIAALYNKIGIVHQQKRNLASALEATLKALKIYEHKGLEQYAAYCLNNIAILYHDQGNYEKSIEYHKKIINYRRKSQNSYDLGASYLNLGNVIFGGGNTDKGLVYFDSALTILKQYPEKEGLASALSSMGAAYNSLGQYQNALNHLKQAYQIRRKQGNETYITTTQLNLGNTHIQLNNYKLGKQMLDSALISAKKIGIKEHIKQAYHFLASYYEDVGEYYQSLTSFKNFTLYSDSINNSEINEKIAEMQTRFDTEKKEQEIEKLSQEKIIKDLTIREKNNQLLIVTLALIVVLISAFIFYQVYRNKQKQKLTQAIIDEQKRGLKAVITATENERQRIAKDLHDGIGQVLSGIKLSLSTYTESLPANKIDTYNNVLNTVDEACTEVRSISHQMMPKALKEKGLIVAIEDMLNKTLQATNIQHKFFSAGITNQRFEEALEIGLYRIAQELINNIIKHSGATEVNVQISKTKNHLVLLVEDNGKGFKFENESGGLGLMNIKSRANTFNGEINYETKLNQGTVATIRVPIHDQRS